MAANTDSVIDRNFLDYSELSGQQRAILSPPEEPTSKRRKTLSRPPPAEPVRLLKPSKKILKKSERARDSFLQNVPKADQWHKRQIKVVDTATKYEAVIRSLAELGKADAREEFSQKCPELDNDFVMVGAKLALLTKSFAGKKNPIFCFHALLLLSYCVFLEKRGVSYATVDQITEVVFSLREMDRRSLRNHALRINRLIHELVQGGWTLYRATELFFINPQSPTYFMSINEEGFQYIREKLTEDEYVKHDFIDCLRPEYTIPGLIMNMIHMTNSAITLSIHEICVSLGYDPTVVPTSIDRIHEVRYPIRNDSAAPISFVFVTGPDSFRSEKPFSFPSTSREMQNATGALKSNLSGTTMIILFHAMGCHIPKIFLDRAVHAQRRIDKIGKQYEIKPQDAGLDYNLVHLLDETRLRESIEHFISLSIISVQGEVYVCQDESAQKLFEQSRFYWIHQTFMLYCHVFPRSIDPSFSSGRELLGVLHHILRLYAESGLEPPRCNNTVETLVSASKLEGLNKREKLLIMAGRLQPNSPEPHIRAEIVYRLSVIFRFTGRIADSERIIKKFLEQNSELGQEWHHFLGLLHLSQANNQAYRFNFSQAHEETRKWQFSSATLSSSEVSLLSDQICCNGRILRGEGRFDEARHCFEGCLTTPGLPRSKRLLVTSHLSDLYCELDYSQRNTIWQSTLDSGYLGRGREIVQREIDCERLCDKPSRGLRRLLLSLMEIEIRQNRINEAEHIICELLGIYSSIAEPDVNDRVGHVRTLIAKARISQLCEAERHWNAALLQNKAYNPLEEEVFTCGVIYLFTSSIRFQLKDVDGSRGIFEKAMRVIGRKRPQFLMPGIGTYLFDCVRLDLQSRADWTLPKIAE